mgnify:CR=1 FL=1
MAKQSGYLQRWENETNRLLQATMAITSQYDIDTLQIAIHQTEGWGYDRIITRGVIPLPLGMGI